MTFSLAVILVIALGLGLWLMGAYNGLVSLRNQVKNGFAQIDVQLKRRYELIPNLVEVAKKFMAHERETLEAVLKARASASGAAIQAAANPASAIALRELGGAESALTASLGRLMAVAEAYPNLKADGTMKQLMEELTSTENKVGFARQAFNDSVMAYNIKREQFPTNLIASSFGFSAAEPFQITNVAEREAVKVAF